MQPRLVHAAAFLVVASMLTVPSVFADDLLPADPPESLPEDLVDETTGLVDGILAPDEEDEAEETDDDASDDPSDEEAMIPDEATQAVEDVETTVETVLSDLGPVLAPEEGPTETAPAAEDQEDAPATPASTPAETASPDIAPAVIAAATAAAVGAAVVATKHGLWTRIGATLLAPLFSRFEGPTVLNNARRADLHDRVCRTPGVTVPDLCDATGLSRNAVLHHLRMLEDHDMIVSKRMGRATHWFENGGRYGRERKAAYAVLHDGRSRDVARYVLGNPGATQGQISQALGLSPSVTHWHMKRLEDAALVQRRRAGRTMQCFPGDPLPGLSF